ncbi:hypothetical protein NPIL_376921 [Nephila pilipes]|uniref:Uncharacterized protein n=1 Tax=Nephila pilipes TaxID=299642 RepID=A0A8X6N2B8_NEPPI|nr:hypothetical protein NPIL_376921 [Nephila pilipes]
MFRLSGVANTIEKRKSYHQLILSGIKSSNKTQGLEWARNDHRSGKRISYQFNELSSVKDGVTSKDIDKFCCHLNELKLDMEQLLELYFELKAYDWIRNPFTTNIEKDFL